MSDGVTPFVLPNLSDDQLMVPEDSVARWGAEQVAPASDATLVVAIGLHKQDGVLRYPGQTYYITDPADVERQVAREAIHVPARDAADWWGRPGRVLSPFAGDVERPYSTRQTPGALKIAAGCGFDPGAAGFRLHSAINAHSRHASTFIRFYDTSPFCSLRQLDGIGDAHAVRDALFTADVIHCHANYLLLNNAGMQPQPGQTLVMHYHGSQPDGKILCAERMPGSRMPLLAWDVTRGAKVVGARLTLVDDIARVAADLSLDVTPAWVPIPVDVPLYRALVPADRPARPFRVAHSPTHRAFKGSHVFERVVAQLQARGVPIEPVLIQKQTLGDALRLKATCHATFDSFWLGMQGSGLEAAAMGQPVVAGDPDAARAHREFCGHVPYTYANDERTLAEQLERLATDPEYYAAESARVGAFVQAHHDYPAVARRYEALLARWTGREDVVSTDIAPAADKPARRRPSRKRAA